MPISHNGSAKQARIPQFRQEPAPRSQGRCAGMRASCASGLFTQFLQGKHTFLYVSIGKLPRGEPLHASIHTLLRLAALTANAALNIRNIPKGSTEHLLLLCAMRAPVSPIHFHLLCRQALSEDIIPVSSFVT